MNELITIPYWFYLTLLFMSGSSVGYLLGTLFVILW